MYFLAQMEEKQAEQGPFKYRLSAFLSAARSVTFYVQKEFKHTPGFEEWYAQKQEEMRADPAMRFFLQRWSKPLAHRWWRENKCLLQDFSLENSAGYRTVQFLAIRQYDIPVQPL